MTTVLTPTIAADIGESAGNFIIVLVVATLIGMLVLREFGSVEAQSGRSSPQLRFLLAAINAPALALLAVFVVIRPPG